MSTLFKIISLISIHIISMSPFLPSNPSLKCFPQPSLKFTVSICGIYIHSPESSYYCLCVHGFRVNPLGLGDRSRGQPLEETDSPSFSNHYP